MCSGYRSITDIRLGHERNKPICIICPAGINSPLKVATNEVIHWMNVGVEREKERKRKKGREKRCQRERGRRRERDGPSWRGGVRTDPTYIGCSKIEI